MQQTPRIEEQIVSKAAELMLSSLLDEAERIDVDVHTNLFEIVQGEADSVSIVGKGLVVQKDIRLHYMSLETEDIAIDTLSAISGKPELNQPINATARIVLLEKDINRALNSDYIHNQMQNFELNVDGQIVNLEMQQMELLLPSKGKMVFNGKVLLHEIGKTRQVGFSAVIYPRTHSQPLLVEGFHCTNAEYISLELAVALLEKIKELTHLPYFDLDKISFQIKEMEVQEGRIIMQTEAYIKEIPQT